MKAVIDACRWFLRAMFVATVATLALCGPLFATPEACNALARVAIPRASLMAEEISADSFKMPTAQQERPGMNLGGRLQRPDHHAFCRVRAVLRPGEASEIKSEIWLPVAGWNGKFLHVASFGWGGTLNYQQMLTALQDGYATAMNDTGHDSSAPDGEGGRFALGPEDRMIDYAYRANHTMAEAAKLLIRRYYGSAASKSYLVGCSLGGLQGLVAAKRYPADYDGIVSGAPPNPIVAFNALQLWPSWLIARNPARYIPGYKLDAVTAAAVKSCATPVGQAQGFIEQPDRCQFDPATLQCASGQDRPDCLTPDQVFLMRKIYEGASNPRTGERIFVGQARGAEADLKPFVSYQPFPIALDMFRYAAFKDPSWSLGAMDFDGSYAAAVARVGPLMHVDSDLTPFLRRGGKLLFYIGWNDGHNPLDLIDYARAVAAKAGPAAVNMRLFTVPGMGHCAGGNGCDTFDKLAVIDQWATGGAAPERIIARRYEGGQVVRSRPICAWPMVARYKGSGDPASADSYDCASSDST